MQAAAKRLPLAFVLAFVALGGVFVALGAALGWSSWNHLAGAERVEGTVVELRRVRESPKQNSKGQPVAPKPGLVPKVRYEVDGQTYHALGHVSSTRCPYAIGTTVTVVYPPDRPSEGKIDTLSENWLAPLGFGVAGLLFSVIGLGMLWVRNRAAREEAARQGRRSRRKGRTALPSVL
jgi:hypothetical protein